MEEELVKEEVETATVTLSGSADNAPGGVVVEEEDWYRTLDEFLKMEPEDGAFEGGEFAQDFDINMQQIVAQNAVQGEISVDLNQQPAVLAPNVDQSTVDDEFDNQEEFTEELRDNAEQIEGEVVVSEATNEKQTNTHIEQEINADQVVESEHKAVSPRNNAMIIDVDSDSEPEEEADDEAAESEHNSGSPRNDTAAMIINVEPNSHIERAINDDTVESEQNTSSHSKDNDPMIIDLESDSDNEQEINDETAESEHKADSPPNDDNAIINLDSESESEQEINPDAVEINVESELDAGSPKSEAIEMIINVEPVKEIVEEILLQIEETNAMRIAKEEEEEESMIIDVSPSTSSALRRSTRAKRSSVNYAGGDEEPVKGRAKAPPVSRPKRQSSTLPSILQPRLPKTKPPKSPTVARSKRKSTLPRKIPQPEHQSQSSYQCQDCGKEFATLWPLKRHRKTVHFGERLYPCPECDKRFKESDQLKRHLKDSHVEVKPFECGRCEKRFSRQTDLKRHRETHDPAETRFKPFACPLDGCERAFTLAADLRAHLHVHTGKRPFKCPDCGKAFGKEGNLKVHRRTHSGERPYSCSVCAKNFGHSSDVRRHLRKVHGVEP